MIDHKPKGTEEKILLLVKFGGKDRDIQPYFDLIDFDKRKGRDVGP